jgi:hypothetical protein
MVFLRTERCQIILVKNPEDFLLLHRKVAHNKDLLVFHQKHCFFLSGFIEFRV